MLRVPASDGRVLRLLGSLLACQLQGPPLWDRRGLFHGEGRRTVGKDTGGR